MNASSRAWPFADGDGKEEEDDDGIEEQIDEDREDGSRKDDDDEGDDCQHLGTPARPPPGLLLRRWAIAPPTSPFVDDRPSTPQVPAPPPSPVAWGDGGSMPQPALAASEAGWEERSCGWCVRSRDEARTCVHATAMLLQETGKMGLAMLAQGTTDGMVDVRAWLGVLDGVRCDLEAQSSIEGGVDARAVVALAARVAERRVVQERGHFPSVLERAEVGQSPKPAPNKDGSAGRTAVTTVSRTWAWTAMQTLGVLVGTVVCCAWRRLSQVASSLLETEQKVFI